MLACLIVALLPGCEAPTREPEAWIATAPAGNAYTQINPDSATVLPNGRLITPLGKTIRVAPHPYGLVLSPDGSTVITANSGTAPLSITFLRNGLGGTPTVQQIPPGADTDKGILASVFMGLAVSPDNQTVYVGGGQENKVYRFDVATGAARGFIDCSLAVAGDTTPYRHGYVGDLVLSRDGNTLYAVDQINFQMLVADTKAGKVTHRVPVGRYPFGITLSPDGQRAYVANVGMYQYKILPSVDAKDLDRTSLPFPTSAYLSDSANNGYRNDTLDVPGLGEANPPESFSVWTVDLSNPAQPRVTAKVKTGFLVGEKVEDIPAVGGASPNSVVATQKYVFVSNGSNDCISVIDAQQNRVVQNIRLVLDARMSGLRGIIPFGLALSPDGKRLYVAESGINAVGVIDVPSLTVLGHLPVGWFPSKLAVSRDGKQLVVANAKGYGSGPNAGTGFRPGAAPLTGRRRSSNIGLLMHGTVSVLDIPADGELKKQTQRVTDNNFTFATPAGGPDNPIPRYAKQKESPIKYFVFVAKENRTYDEVFGGVKGGQGDPALARYGAGVTFASQDGSRKVENATVMPNHLALAGRFAISDNFYCDADHSADGHRWLAGVYPNEWVESSVSAAYGGNREFRMDSKAPGNPSFVGSSAVVMPEDYNEAGSIWEHFERNRVRFFNFGFGLEMPPGLEKPTSAYKYSGTRTVYNYPLSAPLYRNSSRRFATFNMGIPDQFRMDMFIREYNDRWKDNGQLPAVLTIVLPNDHGSGERPNEGYPFNESYMADNDLALGRLVEFLSRTPYWKNMAILVTEDDPQGGVDHVDAHRSLLMLMSPYAKKNYVGHVHYSFGSVFKTMWHALGTPYLNQYDAGASDLADLFAAPPDFTPYNARPVDPRIFDPQKALDPLDEKFNWKAVAESPRMDDPVDMLRDSKAYDQAANRKRIAK
ncbi:MAG: hypothetical protein H7Z75_23120 [Ferruginibacter sp.]|nr:hypothetical protein [Cytophagales bacterium]